MVIVVTGLGAASALVAALVFMGGMLLILYTDLTQQRIYNWILMLLVALYPPLAISSGFDFTAIVMAIGTAMLVFMAGIGCFSAGWLGVDSVKLAAICALWLGPETIISFTLWTLILGSMVTMSVMALRRKRALDEGRPYLAGQPLPFGPGMALAAVILFPQSTWGVI